MMKISQPDTRGRWLMSNCISFHASTLETMCGRKQLSEKGRIQWQWKFFFAHMNCLDCKKLLSCLAVLWKGPVFKLHSAPDYQRYWLDRREQKRGGRNACVIIFQRRKWIPY
jgi:hypothetical protein